ncbi:MAG: hypothetical protein RI920_2437 [Pseudomonadota bacterium]|jgi:hypothetical protein
MPPEHGHKSLHQIAPKLLLWINELAFYGKLIALYKRQIAEGGLSLTDRQKAAVA